MNEFIDKLGDFISKYPGLLPLVGIGLIILNWILQFFPGNWLVDSNFFLHLGLVISLIGILVIRPLG